MEDNIIIYLQSFSTKLLDVLMQAESYMASWLGAIFIFLIIILFVNKKFGLIFCGGFLATLGVNYCIKEIVARPRPYIANPQIINKLTTIGKSFPSGHSVSVIFIVLTLFYLFWYLNSQGKFKLYNKVWFKILVYTLGAVFIILTAISRMYLGQHYLTDIIAGLALGSIGFVITWLIARKKLDKKSV